MILIVVLIERFISRCVCNRYLVCVMWTNYDVVGFEYRSGVTPSLDSFAYFCVPIPYLPCCSIPRLSHLTGSSTHLVVARLRPSIYRHRTGSSSHLDVSCIHTRITDFPLRCSRYHPLSLLCVTIVPSPPPCFPRYSIQGCPKMFFWSIFPSPCVPPESSPLIALLSCTHLKNWSQSHTMCHCLLSSPYVGYIRLSSRTTSALGFTYLPSAFRCTCFLVVCLRKPVCVTSTFLSITSKITQVSEPKSSTACATTL